MKKMFLSFAVAAFFTIAAQAQYLTAFNNLTAYQTTGNTDTESLLRAKDAIDEAVTDEKGKLSGKNWYYKGLIYQLIGENKTTSANHPDAFYTASKAYQQAFNVADPKFKQDKESIQNLITASTQLYNQGVDQYQSKLYNESLKTFEEVSNIKSFLTAKGIQNNIDDNNSLFNAALAALKVENNVKAKEIMHKLIDNNYDNAPLYTSLANIYIAEKNLDKAKEVLAKGTARYPGNVDIIISEVNIYLAEGKSNEVLEKMKKAATLDPANHQLQFAIGVTYFELKDNVKAEEYYKNAITLKPDYYEPYQNLGKIYLDAANEFINKMNDPKVTDAKYKEYEKARDLNLNTALPYFEKAASIEPKNREVLVVLKEVYAKLNMFDKSKEIKLRLEQLK